MSDVDKKFSEDYWKGVADALSLVEDFIYWQREHPDESKDILEFVQECLTEVRKKIGPSLLDLLGVSFTKQRLEKEEKEAETPIEKVTTESTTEVSIEEVKSEIDAEKASIEPRKEEEIVSEIDSINLDEE